MKTNKCECKDAKIACLILVRAGLLVNVKIMCEICEKLWDIQEEQNEKGKS